MTFQNISSLFSDESFEIVFKGLDKDQAKLAAIEIDLIKTQIDVNKKWI